MRKLLLTLMIGLCAAQASAQAFIGESSRIVTAYLDLTKAKYYTVLNRKWEVSLIVQNMEGSTAVYYFKGGECVEYSLVKYNATLQSTVASLNRDYPKEGEYWCVEAENAYIGVAQTEGIVFVNKFIKRDWHLY